MSAALCDRMPKLTLLCSLLSLGACVADAGPDSSSSASAESSIAPESIDALAGIKITELRWTWHGCGPSASPLPFSLTVDVDVDSPVLAYKIKGDAFACDPFDASGETELCRASPAAVVRTLNVSATTGQITDTRTVPLQDCVDGKAQF
jgi:hypothetical protein